uniref:Retrotransposon gag domain-containing protein n=1 Tax=Brassica oleracea var. oleracea TaxID=109376 RepID=A0A0D3C9Z2_BRAOL
MISKLRSVAALSTQNTTPAIRNRRNTRNVADSDEEDDNPFAPLRQHKPQNNRNINSNSDSEEDDVDSSCKSYFKLDIPEFNGSTIAEELLDWFVTIEKILDFKDTPLDRCVPLIAVCFRDRAAAWWSQTKTTRARLGKSEIMSWDKLKQEMHKNFLLYNYEQ